MEGDGQESGIDQNHGVMRRGQLSFGFLARLGPPEMSAFPPLPGVQRTSSALIYEYTP